ncbi:hypothetical protein BC332_16373 [Capsicum chinense]|nr:hypothetical protein BC332_16373 [Capsicum chinense]
MSRRRRSWPLSEIQKLAKILPTYLDMSSFLDQKVSIGWSMIEAYRDKMVNPFDVQYVEGIAQQTIGSLLEAILLRFGCCSLREMGNNGARLGRVGVFGPDGGCNELLGLLSFN